MDLPKLIAAAREMNIPGLAERGVQIARDAAQFAQMVSTNAARGGAVLVAGTPADFDAIHAEALAAADTLDGKLAAAEQR